MRKDGGATESSKAEPTPRVSRPKVLAIDCPELAAAISKLGFAVNEASFGKKFIIERSDNVVPVVRNDTLPGNIDEHDVVIVDTAAYQTNSADPAPRAVNKETAPGESDWWCSCKDGFVYPGTRSMVEARPHIDRILGHGGALIVFSSPRLEQDLQEGRVSEAGGVLGGYFKIRRIDADNWSFAAELDGLEIKQRVGTDIRALAGDSVTRSVGRLIEGSKFLCVFSTIPEGWQSVATNRYGDLVALVRPPTSSVKGTILLLPRVERMDHAASILFKEILPTLAPAVFPMSEGSGWINKAAYIFTGR